MRRRELLGEGIKLTLSATGGTANAANNSTATFTVYNNGSAIKTTGVTVTSTQSWASCSFNTGTGVVTVTCQENTDFSSNRSTAIKVEYKGASANYQLTQNAGSWDLSPNSGTAGAKANSTTTFTVRRNGAAITDGGVTVSSNQSWCTASFNSSNGVVTNTCTLNESFTNTRSASITVTYAGQTKQYTLTQSASSWALSSGSYSSCSPGSATTTVYIKVNGEDYTGSNYTVAESLDWVTTSKSGSATTITINANTANSGRSGTVTFQFTGQTKDYSISQGTQNNLLQVRFSNGQNYSYFNWPSSSVAVPIGIVSPGWPTKETLPYSSDTEYFPVNNPPSAGTASGLCVSLKYMAIENPDNGTTSWSEMYWGAYGKNTGCGYATVKNAYLDMNGRTKTDQLLSYVDSHEGTSWRTANTIQSDWFSNHIAPAECCWRYHTPGTNQGDWYLPAAGEILPIFYYRAQYNCTCKALNEKYGSGTAIPNAYPANEFTSTEISAKYVAITSMFSIYDINDWYKSSDSTCLAMLKP